MKIQGLIEEIVIGDYPIRVAIDDQQQNGLLLNIAPDANVVFSRDKVNGLFFIRIFRDQTSPLDENEEVLYSG